MSVHIRGLGTLSKDFSELEFNDGEVFRCTPLETVGVLEPFGEMTFMSAVEAYKAALKEKTDADCAVLCADTLGEMRAAVIASRKVEKPLMILLTVDDEGKTATGADALACLICLQEMGITAFGICGGNDSSTSAEIIVSLFPYAKVPLIAQADDELKAQKLALCGAEIFYGLKSAEGLKEPVMLPKKQDTSLVFSNETDVFFLEPDAIEMGPPLDPLSDMSDELVEMTDTNYDTVTIELDSAEDAVDFSMNAHMARRPVIFRSDNPIALKSALLTYHGRALVDSSCTIEREELEKIAHKYGAVVY